MKQIGLCLTLTALCMTVVPLAQQAGSGPATPRRQPGAEITLYEPEAHDLYDGRFILSGARIYQVGRLKEEPGWNHMGNDASKAHRVEGTAEIDVNEIENTGRVVARLKVPEGELVLEIEYYEHYTGLALPLQEPY